MNDQANGIVEKSSAPQGVSGRKLTSVVLVLLVVLGGGLSYVLWTYNKIDGHRAKAEVAWQDLANQLSSRYAIAEKELAKKVDNETEKMEVGEQFRLAVDRFRTSAQLNLQLQAARDVEKSLRESSWLDAPSESITTALASYNGHLADVRNEIASPGGKFLSMFLNFANYDALELASAN